VRGDSFIKFDPSLNISSSKSNKEQGKVCTMVDSKICTRPAVVRARFLYAEK
jgi:hypothetical protein